MRVSSEEQKVLDSIKLTVDAQPRRAAHGARGGAGGRARARRRERCDPRRRRERHGQDDGPRRSEGARAPSRARRFAHRRSALAARQLARLPTRRGGCAPRRRSSRARSRSRLPSRTGRSSPVRTARTLPSSPRRRRRGARRRCSATQWKIAPGGVAPPGVRPIFSRIWSYCSSVAPRHRHFDGNGHKTSLCGLKHRCYDAFGFARALRSRQ